MNDFKRSLLFAGSICACIASPFLLLAYPLAHLSHTGNQAREASYHSLGVGIVFLCFGIWGVLNETRSGARQDVNHGNNPNRCATISMVLGFPLFGMMTWGITSIAGIVFGIIGLRKACGAEGTGGRRKAIAGICISFAVFPLILVMLLFLGP